MMPERISSCLKNIYPFQQQRIVNRASKINVTRQREIIYMHLFEDDAEKLKLISSYCMSAAATFSQTDNWNK